MVPEIEGTEGTVKKGAEEKNYKEKSVEKSKIEFYSFNHQKNGLK
jgi:hypothetical protein